MKFLCVECDTPMALTSTSGPDNGSMRVLFKCRSCDREIAMLTNAMETQMVHSLGVKIGANGVSGTDGVSAANGDSGSGQHADAPMGTIRSTLRGYSDSAGPVQNEDSEIPENAHSAGLGTDAGESASKCPFTGMVSEQMEKQADSHGPVWTPEAEARMAQIPSFIRPMVQKGIEEHARSNKCPVIDDALIDSVRNTMGM